MGEGKSKIKDSRLKIKNSKSRPHPNLPLRGGRNEELKIEEYNTFRRKKSPPPMAEGFIEYCLSVSGLRALSYGLNETVLEFVSPNMKYAP